MGVVRKVKRVVALNPVARAVALRNLQVATTNVLVRLYLLPDGEDVRVQIVDANELLGIVMRCVELYGDVGTPDYRVMRGTQSCMVQLAQSGFIWHGRHAPAIDQGLRRALELQPTFTAMQIKTAWEELMSLARAEALQKPVS